MAEGISRQTDSTYERRLDEDGRWALSEGGRHFSGKSEVHSTLERICSRLNELQIPYALAGGMALFQHGYRRFTEDVDILVSRESLKRIHAELCGLGYLPLFEGSKNLRDTQSGVRIEFLLSGEYPGDGRQKPVAFPEPEAAAELSDNIHLLRLPILVELKLASGLTGADRMKDLADVQELIKRFALPADFADQLNPYVQPTYRELWQATAAGARRYIRRWPTDSAANGVRTIGDLVDHLPADAALLSSMRDEGVVLDPAKGKPGLYACLVTTDPEVARRYDMHDESEFLGDDEM